MASAVKGTAIFDAPPHGNSLTGSESRNAHPRSDFHDEVVVTTNAQHYAHVIAKVDQFLDLSLEDIRSGTRRGIDPNPFRDATRPYFAPLRQRY